MFANDQKQLWLCQILNIQIIVALLWLAARATMLYALTFFEMLLYFLLLQSCKVHIF